MDLISEISRLRKGFAEADYFDDQYIAGALMALDAIAKYFDDDDTKYYVKFGGLYLYKNNDENEFVFKKEHATVFFRREKAEGYALITGGIVEVAK